MPDLVDATRPIMWNVEGAWVMYVMMFVALGVFAVGLYRRVAVWRAARSDNDRLGDWGRRGWILIKELALQKRVRGSRLPGIFHSFLFYGFAVLLITTTVVALDYDVGTDFFEGYLYVVLSLGAEIAGLLLLVGVGIALARRLRKRSPELASGPFDLWPLAHIGLIVLTGFVVEGLRIATLNDPWAPISFVGSGVGLLFGGLGAKSSGAAHQIVWWIHAALAFAWIGSIPYTKFFHLVALPTNVFFSRLGPIGQLRRIDLLTLMELDDFDEDALEVGLERTGDFTWKHRLDFDACLSCGRCEEVCPAFRAEMPFSPKQLITGCRDLCLQPPVDGDLPNRGRSLVPDAFDEQFVWHCRTCTACTEACPAAVDHLDTLIDIRRNEVLIQGRVPDEAARTLRQMDTTGNPFGTQGDRKDWIDKLGLRIVGAKERCDVLYWVGCCTTFDPTKQKIGEDIATLLDACGLDFGVLGADEKCCGDPARVLGEERLFQEIAREQVERLNDRKFDVLLTTCPHCYNVLKNEFPQFGGNYEVVHHAEFLHEMLWSKRLEMVSGPAKRVVYHDPCYLGRYQQIYDAPREVLRSLAGAQIAEMQDSREKSLCCGGGGGHFWMDLKKGNRINQLRVRQALEAGADTIVTSCSFCNEMLEDAVKTLDLDDRLEVCDIASMVSAAYRPRTAKKKFVA